MQRECYQSWTFQSRTNLVMLWSVQNRDRFGVGSQSVDSSQSKAKKKSKALL